MIISLIINKFYFKKNSFNDLLLLEFITVIYFKQHLIVYEHT